MRLHPSCEVLGKPNNKDIAATAHADAWRMHYASLCYVENFPSFHMTSIDITSLKNNQIVRQIFPEGFIVGAKVESFFELAKKNEKKMWMAQKNRIETVLLTFHFPIFLIFAVWLVWFCHF